MGKEKSEIGNRYGRLTVVERAENNGRGDAMWKCSCECGNTSVVKGGSLRSGRARSCGCLLSEKSKDRMQAMVTKHGGRGTNLYRVWCGIKERCLNENNKSYHNYGGRGITICDQWKDDFVAFRDWAMENGYKEGLEIDRKDNDGPYSPENCRWTTPVENCQNKRGVVPVVITDTRTGIEATVRTIAEASRMTGVSQNTIRRMVQGHRTKERQFLFRKKED